MASGYESQLSAQEAAASKLTDAIIGLPGELSDEERATLRETVAEVRGDEGRGGGRGGERGGRGGGENGGRGGRGGRN